MSNNKDIICIIIERDSGYFSDNIYTEKITIERRSIRFEKKVLCDYDDTKQRQWSYKTNNPLFQELFESLCIEVKLLLQSRDDLFCTDVGETTISVTYSDKTRFSRDFFLPERCFENCCEIITKMTPSCERI